MKIFMDYLVNNYVLLIMLIGIIFLSIYDVFLDKSMVFKLRLACYTLFTLSVFEGLETYCANLETFTRWRIFFSAVCYSLRPVVILIIIFLVYAKTKKYIIIPAIINVFFSFSAFFTGVVFTFDRKMNYFVRGPLGYATYVICGFYLLVLVVLTFRSTNRFFLEENLLILFFTFATIGAAMLALLRSADILANPTYAAAILLYYLYTYSQYTKKDTLTGLFNRQSFYSDFDKYGEVFSGVISIDMNELKWLNDNYGHSAGDKALKTVSDCFVKNCNSLDKVYRIGGDEFMILCRRRTKEDMELMVENMRKSIDEAGYSCAFGLSAGKTPDEMVKEADELMYADKEKIKAEMKVTGATIHFRD